MHIRSGQRDIAQGRRFEFARAHAVIMQRNFAPGMTFERDPVAEGETAVAAEARQLLAEEQDLAALGSIRYRIIVAGVMIAVVRRARRNNASLERRNGFH